MGYSYRLDVHLRRRPELKGHGYRHDAEGGRLVHAIQIEGVVDRTNLGHSRERGTANRRAGSLIEDRKR